MTESLRALLAGAIDYAGMFPPAGLPLEQALAKYRQHRSGPEAWMVGRFVCPAAQLGKLGETFRPKHDGSVTVIVPGADSGAAFPNILDEALTIVQNSPARGDIDMLECRWPVGLVGPAHAQTMGVIVRVVVRRVTEAKLLPLILFFELPQRESRGSPDAWSRLVRDLAEYNKNAGTDYSSAGFKIRCGSTTPGDIPPAATVAAVVRACRDAGVFWKATAGLHHPFRHVDPEMGVPVHGFINLLTAAVMADVHKLELERVQAILEDDDRWHFRFTNEALTWHDLSATVPQITGARERSLHSFGSCSIDEPWHDLTVLGLI